MKCFKIICLLVIGYLLCGNILYVSAENVEDRINVIQLRAGGGGSGGGTGGSAGSGGGRISSGGSGFYCNHHTVFLCLLDYVSVWLLLIVSIFSGMVVFYFKILRSSFNSKRYMKLISKKDITWNYKNIEKQVIDTFYEVQYAWTNMKMEVAKEYMEDDLYELFRQKIEWMEVGKKRNVLKKIKLINLKPVSVYDDEDNSNDLIWFYIKGSMVDYVVNTETREIVEGKNTLLGISFIEYWKFVRKGDKWVLAKILQENEKDKIIFQ